MQQESKDPISTHLAQTSQFFRMGMLVFNAWLILMLICSGFVILIMGLAFNEQGFSWPWMVAFLVWLALSIGMSRFAKWLWRRSKRRTISIYPAGLEIADPNDSRMIPFDEIESVTQEAFRWLEGIDPSAQNDEM